LDQEKEKEGMDTILIIDDSDTYRTILRKILEQNGYKVIEASDGAKGISIYRENPTDLIITDIIMPEKEGIETIRELTKEFSNIKIIAISGGGRIGAEDYLHIAKMLGAQRTLTKPIKRDKLINVVEELLR